VQEVSSKKSTEILRDSPWRYLRTLNLKSKRGSAPDCKAKLPGCQTIKETGPAPKVQGWSVQ